MPDRMTLLVVRPTPAGLDRRSLDDLAARVAQRLSGRVEVAHLRTWAARAVANWRETRRADRPEVRFTADPAASEGVADAVATLALGATEPVTASPAAFRSPAWSVIDPHDRHLLVCRGPRCTAYGAGEAHRALAAAARGAGTMVTPTGCLGPCNLGPLVVEQPRGTWHERVDTTRAVEIADDR